MNDQKMLTNSPQDRQNILAVILAEFKQEVEKIYQDRLVKLILFGSFATGKATHSSDIDLLVVLKSPIFPEQEIIKMANAAVTLELKYQQMISIMPIAEEDYLQRQSPLMTNIRQEGIAI